MRIEVGERGEIELLEVYTGVVFVTAEGRRYGVAMRDLGIEITRGDKSLLVVDSLPTDGGILKGLRLAQEAEPSTLEGDSAALHSDEWNGNLDALIVQHESTNKETTE